ncbi:RadC family protein [Carnobacterium divergens]|uniref:DNA repair protein RadC n=1 Tax=Carnobacterium divergens DSM 20623 TaxID=1449336 RepID=A0A0R2HXC6_CARDV|nr:DNA repair protein RadC [Carnobacterium divergens]KRN54580.1 DNA repair protein RadC [Carnobacterium divergens DSM 20623]MDO0874065.1 DNA repair protein RadC [Carnobacterium divergens]SUX20454.1 DNA repair protein RadC [Carnobacterium divergens]
MRLTHNLIKEMPKLSRPRERLENDGEKALSTHELLAILLRTGPKDSSAVDLSMSLLASFEDLYYLKTASLEELMCVNGIGRTKAIEIRAAIELGSRIALATQEKKGQVTSSHTIGKRLIKEMKDLQQEHVITLFLNTKNEIIKKETIFVGGLSQSVAHPREIFRGAVRYAAARIIVAHNHPSGNPTPSDADFAFTKRMATCGELMGIELLDHIIIGSDSYISLKEMGAI